MLNLLSQVIADASTDVLKVYLRGAIATSHDITLPNGIRIRDSLYKDAPAWISCPNRSEWIRARYTFTSYLWFIHNGNSK